MLRITLRRAGLAFEGQLVISFLLIAQSGHVTRSEHLSPSIMDFNPAALVWMGSNGVMGRSSPSPQIARVNEGMELTEIREVGGFPGAVHISLMHTAIASNGDVAYIGEGYDGERGGAFLSLQ